MWLYDNCAHINPDDQTGALLFNDDIDGLNAGFRQVLLSGGLAYYVRIENDTSCISNSFIEIIDLKLKAGCMDPQACNFDPLANLDDVVCIYSNCAPDLIINQEVLSSSIFLDSIYNDSECLIPEGCLQGYGMRDIIRFSTQIENVGDADYIVGPPEEESPLFSEDNCHQHWHYLGYAEYLIFNGDGAPQPVGFKNGFCALDFICSESNAYKYDCNYMGISAGCYDIYESDLLCQWIDVTDVTDGTYTLVVRVNYNRAPDIFGRVESKFENNWAQVCIRLDRSSGQLKLEILENCPIFKDCMGIDFGSTNIDCNGVCGGSDHFGDLDGDGELDESDIADYKEKFREKNISPEPCYDLDGDSIITIYDILLLEECLFNNPLNEEEPNHIHCDFPRSITALNDTITFSLGPLNIDDNSLLISYKSNTPIKGIDLSISNVRIDSISLSDSLFSSVLLNNENRISFYTNDDSHLISKTAMFLPLARIYISEVEALRTCFENLYTVVNDKNEKVNVLYNLACSDLSTTDVAVLKASDIFSISPNPTSDIIHVSNLNNTNKKWMHIYNIYGDLMKEKEIISNSDTAINVSGLPTGMYIIHIYSKHMSNFRRFIKT